jgi:hypothetical protein
LRSWQVLGRSAEGGHMQLQPCLRIQIEHRATLCGTQDLSHPLKETLLQGAGEPSGSAQLPTADVV